MIRPHDRRATKLSEKEKDIKIDGKRGRANFNIERKSRGTNNGRSTYSGAEFDMTFNVEKFFARAVPLTGSSERRD